MINFSKIFFVASFLLLCENAYAYSSPGSPTGYVTDFANIISDETQTTLENQLQEFSASTSIEIAIATVNSLDGDSVENYANELFREWGIGKEEYNNGILFLIAPNDRKTRIEVGYGLEGVMPDIQAGYIIDNIILPEFRNNNYDQGIILGTNAIINVVKGERFEYSGNNSNQKDYSDFLVVLFIMAFFVFQWIVALLASTKSWWLGGVLGVGVGFLISYILYQPAINFVFPMSLGVSGLLLDYSISKAYKKYLKRGGKKSPWKWGMGSGFGGGGSGGGFGGGSSGGGGASGSW